MGQIKFHLNKFDKKLYFQLIEIDPSLCGKAYVADFGDYHIIIGAVQEWSQQFGRYSSGANCGHRIGHTQKLTFLLNSCVEKLSPLDLSFDTNEERDLMYDRIIKTYKESISNNLWITK